MTIKHLPLLAVALIGSLTASAQKAIQIPLPASQNPSNSDPPISAAVWAGDTLYVSGWLDPDLKTHIDTTSQTVSVIKDIQKFLESLTATYAQPKFNEAAEKNGFKIYSEPRGAPENVGEVLEAIPPVVRTNPVTGWKSIFPVGGHISHINDVTELESKALLKWFSRLLVDNHDLQVRFKWKNPNDIAIWDNRSTFHTATYDIEGQGERYGVRTVSIGEKPFFDPESKSRREALAAKA